MRRLLIILLSLPMLWLSASADSWETDSLICLLDSRQHLDPIEGIWQFPADGARLFVIKRTATVYDIYLLESPQLDIEPGILIGTASATPKQNTYSAHLDSKKLKDQHLKKATIVITITLEGTMAMNPYSTGKKISFIRWVPYFFRVTIKDNNTRPEGIDGAIRTYPPSPGFAPVIL